MAPKKESMKVSVVEEPPVEPEKPPFTSKYGDAIEGEEAKSSTQNLKQKAQPIRTWLEENIVGVLLQALSALVAHRPSNPHEFLAAYLLKYNPLKPAYPERDVEPIKKATPEEESVAQGDKGKAPTGCDHYKKREPPPPDNTCKDPPNCVRRNSKGPHSPDKAAAASAAAKPTPGQLARKRSTSGAARASALGKAAIPGAAKR